MHLVHIRSCTHVPQDPQLRVCTLYLLRPRRLGTADCPWDAMHLLVPQNTEAYKNNVVQDGLALQHGRQGPQVHKWLFPLHFQGTMLPYVHFYLKIEGSHPRHRSRGICAVPRDGCLEEVRPRDIICHHSGVGRVALVTHHRRTVASDSSTIKPTVPFSRRAS